MACRWCAGSRAAGPSTTIWEISTILSSSTRQQGYNFRELCQPVADTLIRLALDVEFSGRNDLVINGKKISGSAQFIRGARILHHGTLLVDSDLDRISQVLAVKDDKIISKGVKSVRGRVANICEYLPRITVGTFQSHLEETLLGRNLTVYELSEADVAEISALRDSKYATWEWNYGYSPEYDIKKDRRWLSGGLSIYIKVQKGVIQALEAFDIDHYIYRITLDELVEMIAR